MSLSKNLLKSGFDIDSTDLEFFSGYFLFFYNNLFLLFYSAFVHNHYQNSASNFICLA